MPDVPHLVPEHRGDLVLVEGIDQRVAQQHIPEPRQRARDHGVEDRALRVPEEDVGEPEPEPGRELLEPVAERPGRQRASGPGQADERGGDHQQDRPHRGHHAELHHRRRGRVAQCALREIAPRPRRGPRPAGSSRTPSAPCGADTSRAPSPPRPSSTPAPRDTDPTSRGPPPPGTARGSSARRRRTRPSGPSRCGRNPASPVRGSARRRRRGSSPAPGTMPTPALAGTTPSDIHGAGRPRSIPGPIPSPRWPPGPARRPSRSGSSPGPPPAPGGRSNRPRTRRTGRSAAARRG